MTYPIIELTASTVIARLCPGNPERTAEVMCIVDFSAFDEPIGIEIIGFKDQLGHEPPVCRSRFDRKDAQDVVPRWSYDPHVDAFYLHLKGDRAPKQKEIRGSADLGGDGSVLGLRVDFTQ